MVVQTNNHVKPNFHFYLFIYLLRTGTSDGEQSMTNLRLQISQNCKPGLAPIVHRLHWIQVLLAVAVQKFC